MALDRAAQGKEYYTLVGAKDVRGVENSLHDEVEFHGPLATLEGKEAVLEATSNFMKAIEQLTIRATFGSDEQAMIVYNTDIPGIGNDFPGASLLTFEGDLIVKIELFYDGSRFAKKREEIF